MMNRKLAGGLHRVLRKSPVVVAFLCAVILAFVSFYNSNKLQGRHGVLRVTGTQGLRQMYEPETFRLTRYAAANAAMSDEEFSPAENSSVKSLKELVRDAVDRGLVVIVNASDADAARVLADHWHGSRLDISGALDGPMGEILVEVMQELRNVEDMALEVAALKRKIKRFEQEQGNKSNSNRTSGMLPQQGDHGFRPAGRSLHSLLLSSSFRFALDEFTAVGLAAPSLLPNPIPEVEENSCTWVEWEDDSVPFPSPSTTNARVQRGTKRTILIPEGDAPYAVVVIKCLFADPAGSNGYGGHLFINSTAEEDHVLVFSEPPESINKIQFEGPLQHRFAVCTPPIWKPLNPKHLKEWLMYHHHLLGLDRIHYFLYTGIPLDEATLRILQPFLDQEIVTIVDWTHSKMAESRFPSSLLARNDCVHRSRFFADWAVLWDFNEFLQMLLPTNFLPLVTSNTDLPYIAFGNQRWSSAYCIPEAENQTLESSWATDRMVFRLERAPCRKNQNQSSESSSESDESSDECVGGEGSRRHLVNPRKVYAVHHHFIIDPSWGGADISTEKASLNQWIGNFLSTDPGEPTCNIIKEPDAIDPSMPVDGFWYKDVSFAMSSRPAHALAVNASLFSTGFQDVRR